MKTKTEYWENGKIKRAYVLNEEGLRDGAFESYREDGILEEKSFYKNGKKDGLCEKLKYDHKNAGGFLVYQTILFSKGNVVHGKGQSGVIEERYYDIGLGTTERQVYDSKKGTFRLAEKWLYDKEGHSLGSCTYDENGRPVDGVHETQDVHDKTRKIETYKNGKLNGPGKWYGPDGSLIAKYSYKNGKLNGAYEKYLDGELAEKCFYKEGELNGPDEIYKRFLGKMRVINRIMYKDGEEQPMGVEIIKDAVHTVRRFGINLRLRKMNKKMKPDQERQEAKRREIAEYRKKYPKYYDR